MLIDSLVFLAWLLLMPIWIGRWIARTIVSILGPGGDDFPTPAISFNEGDHVAAIRELATPVFFAPFSYVYYPGSGTLDGEAPRGDGYCGQCKAGANFKANFCPRCGRMNPKREVQVASASWESP